jgi:acyl-CoA synthetase (AMP-forming)/AMP-acid ligase II
VCDADGTEVPRGEIGELYIGGVGLAQGYLGSPELTRQRFTSLPGKSGRWYRTGDQVSWDSDALIFHGRVDREQLKVGGARVESGDLEAVLLGLDGIAGAAVTLTDAELVAVLVAYGEQPGPRALRRWLADRLPSYLIPRRFVFVDRLPLTPNGKLDRPAVAQLAEGHHAG